MDEKPILLELKEDNFKRCYFVREDSSIQLFKVKNSTRLLTYTYKMSYLWILVFWELSAFPEKRGCFEKQKQNPFLKNCISGKKTKTKNTPISLSLNGNVGWHYIKMTSAIHFIWQKKYLTDFTTVLQYLHAIINRGWHPLFQKQNAMPLCSGPFPESFPPTLKFTPAKTAIPCPGFRVNTTTHWPWWETVISLQSPVNHKAPSDFSSQCFRGGGVRQRGKASPQHSSVALDLYSCCFFPPFRPGGVRRENSHFKAETFRLMQRQSCCPTVAIIIFYHYYY